MNKKIIFIGLGIVAVAAGAYAVITFLPGSSADAAYCDAHQIAMENCPFCNKKLVEEMGWCAGHDVEEAYCTLCNPRFIPAFKKVGDWCEEHEIPESQCTICKGNTSEQQNVADESGNCRAHQIAMENCPFCNKKLVEEMGWCAGHDVEEAYCTLCNPRFIPAFKKAGDWCEEHEIPMSQCKICKGNTSELQSVADESGNCRAHQIAMEDCPFCNKKLVEEMGWCAGHDVEEAYCTLCNPRFIPAFKKAGDWCEEHEIPMSQCKICEQQGASDARTPEPGGIQLVSSQSTPRYLRKPAVSCKTNELSIHFRSHEIAEKAGLEYAVVEKRAVTATLTCNAEIEFDQQRYARIASRVGGVVSEVNKDLGDRVSTGDVLAVVDSVELANAQGQFLRNRALFDLADKNHDRVHSLVVKGIATEQDDLEAEAKLEEKRVVLSQSRQQLMNLGLNSAQIDEIANTGDTASRLPVTAPFDGVVVERSAVRGEVVDKTRPLFAVADTSRMWAMIDVYEADLFKVRIGQPVVFAIEGLQGEQFGGKITWISAHVDRRTRTLKARAEIDNRDGLLRAHMFGRARVTINDEKPLVVVPKSAVQWEGCCNVVFKKISDLLFTPAKVRLGLATGDHYEILEGLEPDAIVVTQGSYLLKTEILKGSIGAGCCEVDHLAK